MDEIFTGENAMKSEVKNVAKKAVASAMRNAVKNDEGIEWVKKFLANSELDFFFFLARENQSTPSLDPFYTLFIR